MLVYNQVCNKYAALAQKSYEDYLEAKRNYTAFEWPKDSLSAPISDTLILFQYRGQMLSHALSAVVFQALAIEAYVNLFGVSELGNERFFTELEPSRDQKPKGFNWFSTENKLREICRWSDNCTEYPEHHIQAIKAFFDKRNKLVHVKPRAHNLVVKEYNYEKPEENYREYIDMYEELSFVDENLDQEMQLYAQLQENIRVARGATHELTTEQTIEIFNALGDAIQDVFETNKDKGEK